MVQISFPNVQTVFFDYPYLKLARNLFQTITVSQDAPSKLPWGKGLCPVADVM